MTQIIKMILGYRDMNISDLADKLNTSRPNLYNKLKRDNFSEKELVEIAKVLDCTFEAYFSLNDSDEKF